MKSESNEKCASCGTSVEEILQTGFVGCEKCYQMPEVRAAVEQMYNGAKHKED